MNDQVFYLDKTCSIDCFYQEKTLTIGSHPSGVSKAPSSAVLRCACMSSIGPTPSYDQHLPVHIMCFAMLQSIETDVLHFDRQFRMLQSIETDILQFDRHFTVAIGAYRFIS